MEFLELLEFILSQVPAEYAGVAQAVQGVFPWIVLVFSLLVCFFGFKIHHIWAGCVFAVAGFLVGVVIGAFFPQMHINLVLVIALALAGVGVLFTHRLIKIQLFVLNFYMVYTTLPNILEYAIEPEFAIAIGVVCGIILGLIAARYKYIVTIITTACTGALTAAPMIAAMCNFEGLLPRVLLTAPLIILGLVVQFHIEWGAMRREREERHEHARAKRHRNDSEKTEV